MIDNPLSLCRFGQRVTVVIGEPILLEDTVARLESRGAGAEEKRRTITAVIQGRTTTWPDQIVFHVHVEFSFRVGHLVKQLG